MKFIIRADASTLIGSGHVMRCLALAKHLKQHQHQVVFICRDYPGNLMGLIKTEGFAVEPLIFHDEKAYQNQGQTDDYAKWLWVDKKEDALQTHKILKEKKPDWLIVDHYALDQSWQKTLRAQVDKIMVIDDLANRPHDCDLLLDANYYDALEHRYDELVPPACEKLLGTQYALIRHELLAVRAKRATLKKSKPRAFKNILIYFGAADRQNFTTQAITELLALPQVEDYQIHVLIGSINPHQKTIAQLCQQHHLQYYDQSSHYHDLLVKADVAIAAGGSSSYERCFLGIPSLVFVVALNQAQLVTASQQIGAIYHLRELTTKAIAAGLADLNRRFENYARRMSELVDGFGLQRIYQAIEKVSLS